MNDIIKTVSRMVHKPSRPDKNLDSLTEKLNEMYPIESISAERVEQEIREQKEQLRRFLKYNRTGLQVLSEEVFSWVDKKGFPLLAVFDIMGDGVMMLTAAVTKDDIPSCFISKKTWGKTLDMLHKKSNSVFSNSFYTIKTTFNGVIPESTRKKIARFEDEFEMILIVSEAKWTLEKHVYHKTYGGGLTEIGDPLVVGYDGKCFWLIDVFDTTSVEQLIADEFCNYPSV